MSETQQPKHADRAIMQYLTDCIEPQTRGDIQTATGYSSTEVHNALARLRRADKATALPNPLEPRGKLYEVSA